VYDSICGGHTSCYMTVECRLLGGVPMSYPAVGDRVKRYPWVSYRATYH